MGKRIDISPEDYLRGLDDVVEHLQACVDDMERGSAKGLADAAAYVLSEAAERAPVETGDLRGSGYVNLDGTQFAKYDQPTITKAEAKQGKKPPPGKLITEDTVADNVIRAEIGFDTPYAAQQHEQIYYDHPRGGQAKYLESVLVEESDHILQAIAGGVIDELFGGGADG